MKSISLVYISFSNVLQESCKMNTGWSFEQANVDSSLWIGNISPVLSFLGNLPWSVE